MRKSLIPQSMLVSAARNGWSCHFRLYCAVWGESLLLPDPIDIPEGWDTYLVYVISTGPSCVETQLSSLCA